MNGNVQPAIIGKDNIHMHFLSKTLITKSFQPQNLKPGSEDTMKGDLVDTDDGDEKDAEMSVKTKMNKSQKNKTLEILEGVHKSLDSCKAAEELEKANDEEVEESVDKALTSIAVSGLSRRQRLDAAYKLGISRGREHNVMRTDPVVLDLDIGTKKTRPTHEPPVVPVRTVTPPNQPMRAAEETQACAQHGYVHKSDTRCPICVQAEVTEALPYWRR